MLVSLQCLICYSKFQSEKSQYPQLFTKIFKMYCEHLKINLTEIESMQWNFKERDNVPFCAVCYSTVEKLWKFNEELQSIQESINDILETTKCEIIKSKRGVEFSLKRGNRVSASNRVEHFRYLATRDLDPDVVISKNNVYNQRPSLTPVSTLSSKDKSPDHPVLANIKIEDSELSDSIDDDDGSDPLFASGNHKQNEFESHSSGGCSDSQSDMCSEMEEDENHDDPDFNSHESCDSNYKTTNAGTQKAFDPNTTYNNAFGDKPELVYQPKDPLKTEKIAENPTPGRSLASKIIKRLRHPKTFSGQVKRHHCQICNKAFVSNRKLLEHTRTHTGERPYECTFEGCGKRFAKEDNLVRHGRIHFKSEAHKCLLCNKSFSRKDKLGNHIKSEHGSEEAERMLLCTDSCNLDDTQNRENSDQHIVIKSECRISATASVKKKDTSKGITEKNFQCEICETLFCDKYKLDRHIQTHSESMNFKCGLCESSFKLKEYLLKHHRRRHKTEKLQFTKIDNTNSSQSTQDEELYRGIKMKLVNSDGIFFACGSCEYLSKSRMGLKFHIRTKHFLSSDNYPCKHCYKSFSLKSRLQQHEVMHYEEKNLMCEECGACFKEKETLRHHIDRIHRGMKRFQCLYCSKPFYSKKDCRVHIQHIHAEELKSNDGSSSGGIEAALIPISIFIEPEKEKIIVSGDIDRETVLEGDSLIYFKHEIKLLPTGAYVCSECGLSLDSIDLAKTHIKSDHYDPSNSTFSCKFCGTEFSTIKLRREHEISHQTSESHRCEICGLLFVHLKRLLNHQKNQHNTDNSSIIKKVVRNKRYECEQCGKKFSNNTKLLEHIRTHTGEKPFQCTVIGCGKRFSKSDNFQRHHKRVHSNVTDYKCGSCDKSFAFSWKLKHHNKTIHGIKDTSMTQKELPLVLNSEALGSEIQEGETTVETSNSVFQTGLDSNSTINIIDDGSVL